MGNGNVFNDEYFLNFTIFLDQKSFTVRDAVCYLFTYLFIYLFRCQQDHLLLMVNVIKVKPIHLNDVKILR